MHTQEHQRANAASTNALCLVPFRILCQAKKGGVKCNIIWMVRNPNVGAQISPNNAGSSHDPLAHIHVYIFFIVAIPAVAN